MSSPATWLSVAGLSPGSFAVSSVQLTKGGLKLIITIPPFSFYREAKPLNKMINVKHNKFYYPVFI